MEVIIKKQFAGFVLGSVCMIGNYVYGMDIGEIEWVSDDEPPFSTAIVDEANHFQAELSQIINSQPEFKKNLRQYNFRTFFEILSEFMKNTPTEKDQTLTEENSLALLYPKFCEEILKEGIKISDFPHIVIDRRKNHRRYCCRCAKFC